MVSRSKISRNSLPSEFPGVLALPLALAEISTADQFLQINVNANSFKISPTLSSTGSFLVHFYRVISILNHRFELQA